MLAAYGTDEQKERWLYPLMNQEIWSAYSMTEPQGGSDPNLFKTARRQGRRRVGHQRREVVHQRRPRRRHPLRHVHQRHVRRAHATRRASRSSPSPSTHNHIIYNDVRVPLDHLLGPEDGAKVLAQRRLGGGRIHHAMRTIAQCKKAFDMMCERALSRESHGKIIAEHQMVQEAIADSYAEINMLRLLVLWTAWTIDNSSTQEARTQIAACKYTMAKVLQGGVVPGPAHHGLAGHDQPHAPAGDVRRRADDGLADGADEVHKVTVARNVLKGYRPHEGNWPTEYIPAKRAKARQKYAELFAQDPISRSTPTAWRSTWRHAATERRSRRSR